MTNTLLDGGRIEMKDNRVEMGIGCSAAGNHGTASEEKWDAGACNKRKRGPPNTEKKERKKAKERKKRAEKNRELGVKRLKLQPIQKMKTVAYCRHYLHGKCNLGDQCKYSHDTVPLTKSMPCCKFARNECMKGDDCGYDHDLSKYLCHSFIDNGFCGRGDSCLFLHKMPAEEERETAACKPELKPPMVPSNSRSQQVNSNQTLKRTSPVTTPKGINFLSFGKASPDEARGKSQVSHQTSPGVSETVQNLNGMLRVNQPAASQGTSFNPFGKTSVASSSGGQNLNGMLRDNQPAASQGTSFNPFEKSLVASPGTDRNLKGVQQANQLVASQGIRFNPFGKSSVASSGSDQNLKGIQRANQPTALQGTSFNPFGKSVVTSCSSDQTLRGILHSNQPQGTSCNPFEKSTVSSSSTEKPQNSRATSFRLPSSPCNSGQSSDNVASRFCRGTANSF